MYRFILLLILGLFSLNASASLTKLPTLDSNTINQLYNPNGNRVDGNSLGNVTLVEFFSYNCSYCRKAYPLLKKIMQNNPDVRVVYKEYALFQSDRDAPDYVALAAAKQNKYLLIHDAFMEAKKPLTMDEMLKIADRYHLDVQALQQAAASDEIKNILAQNSSLADSLDIDSVPTFVAAPTRVIASANKVIQYKLTGDVSYRELDELIKKVRDEH